MAGYVIVIGLLAFAAFQLWSHRTPSGGVHVEGTVIEELSVKSTKPGRRTRLYAPRVAYVDPRSGRQETFEPSAFGSARFSAGDPATVIVDSDRDRVTRPMDRPIRDTALFVLLGTGMIAAQFFDR